MQVPPGSSSESCPNCGLPNSYSASICECGYDFGRKIVVPTSYAATGAGGPGGSLRAQGRAYGGLRRLAYVACLVVIGIIVALVDSVTEPGLLELLTLLAALAAALYLMVLRFRNQGATGWWVLAAFVPLVNLYIGVRALAYPEGYADRRRLDLAGKAVVFVAVGVLAVALGAAIALL